MTETRAGLGARLWTAYEYVAMVAGLGALAVLCLVWLPFALLCSALPERIGRVVGRLAIMIGFRLYLHFLSVFCACRFDLSALHGLDLDGTIRFGHLKLAGLKLEQVKLPISLHGGRLVSAGHSLSLYGGSLEGSLNIAADDGRASYRAYLQNADLAPLLVDFGARQKVAGTANFFVDVSSKAESHSSLLRDLQGLARLRLKGGSVPGIDIGQAIREWRGPLGARQGARRAHRERESTAVGELTASFRIDGGVARSTDLKADSGMLRISGAGEINLPQRQIDYLTRVTLLVIPLGPDSGPLASLRGGARCGWPARSSWAPG